MMSSPDYIASLRGRADEYELIITAFERMNAELRAARTSAAPRFREFCDRHIELNTLTLEEMRQSLKHAKSEIDTASPFPEGQEEKT